MDGPRKKPKLSDPSDVSTPHVLAMPTILRGKPFTQNIQKLASQEVPTVASVTTQLQVPYLSGATVNTATPKTVDTFGTFSVLPRYSADPWAQGLLQPFGSTSYFNAEYQYTERHVPQVTNPLKTKKVRDITGASIEGRAIPLDMPLGRATIESRAMKMLAMDQSQYDPTAKPRDAKVLVTDDKAEPFLGGLAMGSHLEDITARRALNFGGIGSAMRAGALAAKWRMQNDNATVEPGFGDRMLTAFPQLGKEDMVKAVKMSGTWTGLNDTPGNPLLGARALNLAMSNGQKQEVEDHHRGIGGSVFRTHIDARNEAKRRFASKMEKITGGDLPATQGTWWGSKAAQMPDITKPDNIERFKNLRDEYVDRKLVRHDVINPAGPRRMAKEAFKAELQRQTRDPAVAKQQDRAAYKQEKFDFVKNLMTQAGFSTKSLDEKRQHTQKFEDKFAQARAGSQPKGSWWDSHVPSKGHADTRSKVELKTLKQQYVAHRRGKTP